MVSPELHYQRNQVFDQYASNCDWNINFLFVSRYFVPSRLNFKYANNETRLTWGNYILIYNSIIFVTNKVSYKQSAVTDEILSGPSPVNVSPTETGQSNAGIKRLEMFSSVKRLFSSHGETSMLDNSTDHFKQVRMWLTMRWILKKLRDNWSEPY